MSTLEIITTATSTARVRKKLTILMFSLSRRGCEWKRISQLNYNNKI